jgi:uncharacterized membrane protein YcaP (DUF421 family)
MVNILLTIYLLIDIMELIVKLFGEGRDLNTLQMCDRAFVIYFIALIFLRISGRRTFGKRTPFDNTLAIILGAVLSRAVVGASPFVSTVACSLLLVVIHRALAWVQLYSKSIQVTLEGSSRVLFQNGKINRSHLKKSLISEEELIGDVRLKSNFNSFDQIEEIYMETTGEVSVVKKSK